MKTLADAIFEAEKHSKHEPKHQALSGLAGEQLRLAMEALNPRRIFNVKKFDMPATYATVDAPLSFFFTMLDQLADRSLSGNAARDAVTETLARYTAHTAKALTRVLLKDLKCGATSNTFIKLYPNAGFVSFELMLAGKIDEKPEIIRKTDKLLTPAVLEKKYGLRFPVLGEAKYDGNRALCRVVDGKVEFISRSGLPMEWLNVADTQAMREIHQEAQAWETYIGQPVVIDGEILGQTFQETARARGSDNIWARENLKMYVFDCMTVDEWDRQSCRKKQYQRSSECEQIIEILQCLRLVKSKYRLCHSISELKHFYTEVLQDGINPDGELNGLGEGLIIKNWDGLYEFDRSRNWWKWKPTLTVDLRIDGFELGKPGSKNANKMGNLLLSGKDENGRIIITSCGGFKVTNPSLAAFIEQQAKLAGITGDVFDKMNKDQFFRTWMYQNFDKVKGMTIEVEGQELSQAHDASTWAVRFPQMLMFRSDK
jgi:DNA ligase-1